MFSQRKRFYERKSFYGIIIALLLAFGFWINQDTDAQQEEGTIKEPVINTGQQAPANGTKDGGEAKAPYYQSDYYPGGQDGSYGSDGQYDSQGGDYDPYGEPDPSENSGSSHGGDEGNEEILGPCFLVREDGGYIKIFSVDENGGQQLMRTTDISFSLLSESDQKLFKQGIVKETKDELSNLLQDFES